MPEQASWRDEASQPVQDDLDELAGAAFDAAERLLGRDREFRPFAVALDADGRQSVVVSDPAPAPEPTPQALLEDLVASVRGERERYRAVGFVALVFIRTGDAVRVELEHRDGGPALVLLRPCRVGRLRHRVRGHRVTMGGVAGTVGSHLVWPRDADVS
jgi:hypothetical protein